jgi:sugar lactone lactonase YvrE
MSVSDDDGNVFSLVSDGSSANQLVRFASKTRAVDYIAGDATWWIGEARLAWEPSTKKIYIAPRFNGPDFFSVEPKTGAIATLASPPGTGVGDAFCGDKSGHIYAQGGDGCNGTTMYRYDIALDTWTAVPDLPFPSLCAGSCAVTADGWLYVTDGGGHLARLKLY